MPFPPARPSRGPALVTLVLVGTAASGCVQADPERPWSTRDRSSETVVASTPAAPSEAEPIQVAEPIPIAPPPTERPTTPSTTITRGPQPERPPAPRTVAATEWALRAESKRSSRSNATWCTCHSPRSNRRLASEISSTVAPSASRSLPGNSPSRALGRSSPDGRDCLQFAGPPATRLLLLSPLRRSVFRPRSLTPSRFSEVRPARLSPTLVPEDCPDVAPHKAARTE